MCRQLCHLTTPAIPNNRPTRRKPTWQQVRADEHVRFMCLALRSRPHLSPHVSLHRYSGVMRKTHLTPPVEARGRMLGRQWRTYEGTWGRGAMTSEGEGWEFRQTERAWMAECGEWVMWRVRSVQLCISGFLPKLARRRGSISKRTLCWMNWVGRN